MTCIVSGVGRLGKDAIVRETDGGPATSFSLAMDDGFGDKKQTLWFDVTGWGKRFAGAAEFLKKGVQAVVTGEMGEREYEGKTYKTLRLLTLDLVSSKPKAA